jgi:prevent-host-death family protein
VATRITSRQFNQDTARAKRAAEDGPVYITDRGRPAHVLLTYEEYERLRCGRSLIELLGEPVGIADAELSVPTSGEPARPASLD